MMIAVPMVNGQEIQVAGIEFTAALGTDRTVDLDGLCSIVAVTVDSAAQFAQKSVRLSRCGKFDRFWPV